MLHREKLTVISLQGQKVLKNICERRVEILRGLKIGAPFLWVDDKDCHDEKILD